MIGRLLKMTRMMHTKYANVISPTEVKCIGEITKDEHNKKYQDKYPNKKTQHKSNK